jgi:hypothetical protein
MQRFPRAQSQTEFEFWKQISGSAEAPPWQSRFERVVRFIRSADRVLDFGCGKAPSRLGRLFRPAR